MLENAMHLVSDDINEYCLNHSFQPSDLCRQLEKETMDSVPLSVMLSGPLVASFLGFLIKANQSKRAVEVGTYTGYSALCMAEHLPPDGEIWTLDINAETVAVGESYWKRSPHGKKIHSLIGPAEETLNQIVGPIDFAFIDADKPGYQRYVELLIPKLSKNAVMVSDNCLWSGRVLNPNDPDPDTIALRAYNRFMLQHPKLQTTLVPIRDGLLLARLR